jgi:hypothetical protein
MADSLDEAKKDAKQIGIYVIGVVMMIIGWFLNDFMEATKVSFSNIYHKQDEQEIRDVTFWQGEAFFYRDQYYSCQNSQCK